MRTTFSTIDSGLIKWSSRRISDNKNARILKVRNTHLSASNRAWKIAWNRGCSKRKERTIITPTPWSSSWSISILTTSGRIDDTQRRLQRGSSTRTIVDEGSTKTIARGNVIAAGLNAPTRSADPPTLENLSIFI